MSFGEAKSCPMGEVPGYAKSDKPLLLVADNFPPLIIREVQGSPAGGSPISHPG